MTVSNSLALSRREMLTRAAGGFGSLALASLLAEESSAAATDPLAPRAPHFAAKATNVIFMFSTGGASHVDTFDYKPNLFADHGKSITIDNWQGKLGEFNRYLKRPDWEFRPRGENGIPVSDLFPHLGNVIDNVCVLNCVEGDHTGHDKATMGMHTGSFNFARPSIGSWSVMAWGLRIATCHRLWCWRLRHLMRVRRFGAAISCPVVIRGRMSNLAPIRCRMLNVCRPVNRCKGWKWSYVIRSTRDT